MSPISITDILWPNFLILFVYFGLIVVALLRLRYQKISDVARVLWVMVIVIVPILGPAAFLITGSRGKPGEAGESH